MVTVASYGGCQPSRIFEPAVVGMSSVVKTSLSASGTPASGPSFSPGGAPGVDGAGLRQRALAVDVQEGVDLARRPRRSGRGGPGRPRRRVTSPAAISAPSLGGGQLDEIELMPSSPRIRGTRNRPSSTAGRAGQRLLRA